MLIVESGSSIALLSASFISDHVITVWIIFWKGIFSGNFYVTYESMSDFTKYIPDYMAYGCMGVHRRSLTV